MHQPWHMPFILFVTFLHLLLIDPSFITDVLQSNGALLHSAGHEYNCCDYAFKVLPFKALCLLSYIDEYIESFILEFLDYIELVAEIVDNLLPLIYSSVSATLQLLV